MTRSFRILPALLPILTAGCATTIEPVNEAEVAGFSMALHDTLAATSPPIEGTLDSTEAVTRALQFNHSLLAERLDAALAKAETRIEAGAALPSVLAERDEWRRNHQPYSRSSASPNYSTSSDIANLTRSISATWNVLDFGLTLLRTSQAADRARQKDENVRRIAAEVTESTRATYWRAVALQALVPRLKSLDSSFEEALALSRKAAADPLLDPSSHINFQRDNLETRREINDIFSSIAGAEHELRSLIAAPLDQPLLLEKRRPEETLRLPASSARDDIARALKQRPEIRQALLDLHINETEVEATFLRLLPGAELSALFIADSNSYLLYGDWTTLGLKFAVNLIEFARLPDRLHGLRTEEALHRQKALATAAAIVMQVHVARAKVAVQLRAFRNAKEYAVSQRELLRQVKSAVSAGRLASQQLTREEASTLLAELRATIAFGDLHAALAAYESATGETALPEAYGEALAGQTATPEG